MLFFSGSDRSVEDLHLALGEEGEAGEKGTVLSCRLKHRLLRHHLVTHAENVPVSLPLIVTYSGQFSPSQLQWERRERWRAGGMLCVAALLKGCGWCLIAFVRANARSRLLVNFLYGSVIGKRGLLITHE